MFLIISKDKSSNVSMLDLVRRAIKFVSRRELLQTIEIILGRAEILSVKYSHLDVLESIHPEHQFDSISDQEKMVGVSALPFIMKFPLNYLC